MLRLPNCRQSPPTGSKRYTCVLCDAEERRVDLPFDSGSVEPTVGETLTGATSGDTGVVVNALVHSGSWAGGDAAGWIVLQNPTGVSGADRSAFQDNETINGSVGGNNMLTADGTGVEKIYGRFYQEGDTAVIDGKRYCAAHYAWRFNHKLEDEIRLIVDEGDRGVD